MPTSEIRADWAAQRIKGLSFFRAAMAAFFGNRGDKVRASSRSSTTRATAPARCGSR